MTTPVEDIKTYNAYNLAVRAGCGHPDAPDSPGAQLLELVRDATLEAVAYVQDENMTVQDAALQVQADHGGGVHEIADAAPSVYTATRWAEFVDLAAYQEDISEFGPSGEDLTATAGVALCMLAERLVRALLDELAQADDEG